MKWGTHVWHACQTHILFSSVSLAIESDLPQDFFCFHVSLERRLLFDWHALHMLMTEGRRKRVSRSVLISMNGALAANYSSSVPAWGHARVLFRTYYLLCFFSIPQSNSSVVSLHTARWDFGLHSLAVKGCDSQVCFSFFSSSTAASATHASHYIYLWYIVEIWKIVALRKMSNA